jgi:sugar/nucleoside kinase (ribokinase family)
LGEKHSIPSRNVNAIDSTGAGDMYAAGFLSALSKGYNSRQSGEIGGRLAEEIIQQFGAQFDLKKMSELNSKVFSIY